MNLITPAIDDALYDARQLDPSGVLGRRIISWLKTNPREWHGGRCSEKPLSPAMRSEGAFHLAHGWSGYIRWIGPWPKGAMLTSEAPKREGYIWLSRPGRRPAHGGTRGRCGIPARSRAIKMSDFNGSWLDSHVRNG